MPMRDDGKYPIEISDGATNHCGFLLEILREAWLLYPAHVAHFLQTDDGLLVARAWNEPEIN